MGPRPSELGHLQKRILTNVGPAALGPTTASPQASGVRCHQTPHYMEADRDRDILVATGLKKNTGGAYSKAPNPQKNEHRHKVPRFHFHFFKIGHKALPLVKSR